MSALRHFARLFSSTPSALRAGLLGFGLAFAVTDPSLAGGTDVNCVLGSKESPFKVVAACSAVINNPATSRTDRAAALVVQADAHAHISGGLTQALTEIDRAIELDPKSGDAYRMRGELTREAGGSLARAEADLTKAIALNPNDTEAYELRGVIYTNQHRTDRAIADYDQVIKLQPNNAQAWADRGVTWYLAGEYEKAIADDDEALRLDPTRDSTLSNRAAAWKKLGKLDKALADDNEAIRLDPKTADYYDNRGLTYAGMKEFDKAIADYDTAIRMEPRANYYTNRGDSHQFKDELGAALADYDAALRLDPNFEMAYNNRAIVYKRMGDRTKALADYEAALRLDPGDENASNGRRIMKAEIAKFGAKSQTTLHAPEDHPSFDCGLARLPVEKAICADPQLGALDHQIADTYTRLINSKDNRSADSLRREQRSFVAARNAGFGKRGYDLRVALQQRLDTLQSAVR
jgi:tetratricopeptide (TPR) repeat protein